MASETQEGDERSAVASQTDALGSWTRRRFLQHGGLAGASVGLAGSWIRPARAEPSPAPQIRRRVTLGRTGLEVPDISFGSFSLETEEDLVRHALDRGITHFDTAEG